MPRCLIRETAHTVSCSGTTRQANRPISIARTVYMTATGEEAVVGKSARVVEKVVVSKTADERVETIDDTVRRTEVKIDRDGDADAGRGSGFARIPGRR